MNQSKQLIDGALLVAIFMGLLLIAIFVPVVSIIASLLMPVPFIFYSHRHSWKPSLLMFAVVIVLVTLLTTYVSIPMAVIPGVGGIMIGTAMKQQASPYETWARGTVGFIVGYLFAYVFSQVIFQVNFVQEFEQMLHESFEQSEQLFAQFGMGTEAEEQVTILKEQLNVLLNLFPMLLIIISLVSAWISQWIGYKLINRIERKQFHFPPFRQLTFPIMTVWIYFFALLISFFIEDQDSYLFLSVQNILALIGIFMSIQGLSFIFFYAYTKGISKAVPIIVTILTVILSPILLPLVRILGIIDIGFQLRHRLRK